MKRYLLSIIALLYSVFYMAQNRKDVGTQFITQFFKGDYEKCELFVSPSVSKQMNRQVLEMAKKQIEFLNGNYESILESVDQDDDTYPSAFYKIKFAKKVSTIKTVFDKEDKIIGFFIAEYPNEKKNRPQTPAPPFDYTTEEVTFKNVKDGNTLAGTIAQPKNATFNTPIAILITGSGAQNRNEELFGHQPFWVIADYFATHGISTLRMDDRGVGESTAGKSTDTTQNFAGDINSAVEQLKKLGYKNIGLVGHSEGGIIAAMVASQNKEVKFVISMAGPGEAIKDLMMKQNETILKLSQIPSDVVNKELQMKEKLFSYVANYQGKDFAKDYNNYLTKEFPSLSPEEKTAYQQLTQPWMAYFLKIKPHDYWKKVTCPVYAINGSLDVQVDTKTNLVAIQNSLKSAKNKAFKIQTFEGLNHLFQTAKTGMPDEYDTIEETISPEVLKSMSGWINGLKL